MKNIFENKSTNSRPPSFINNRKSVQMSQPWMKNNTPSTQKDSEGDKSISNGGLVGVKSVSDKSEETGASANNPVLKARLAMFEKSNASNNNNNTAPKISTKPKMQLKPQTEKENTVNTPSKNSSSNVKAELPVSSLHLRKTSDTNLNSVGSSIQNRISQLSDKSETDTTATNKPLNVALKPRKTPDSITIPSPDSTPNRPTSPKPLSHKTSQFRPSVATKPKPGVASPQNVQSELQNKLAKRNKIIDDAKVPKAASDTDPHKPPKLNNENVLAFQNKLAGNVQHSKPENSASAETVVLRNSVNTTDKPTSIEDVKQRRKSIKRRSYKRHDGLKFYSIEIDKPDTSEWPPDEPPASLDAQDLATLREIITKYKEALSELGMCAFYALIIFMGKLDAARMLVQQPSLELDHHSK